MTLKDRGDGLSREDKVARKRARLMRTLGRSDGAADDGNSVIAQEESRTVVTVSAGGELAPDAQSRELSPRRDKIIALRRSTLKLAGGAPATIPEEDGAESRPRLLVGPMPHVKKSRWMIWSAALIVGLPTLIVGVYFAFFAANQYVSEGRFALRSNDAGGAMATGIAASLGIGGSTPTTGDSYIIVDYLGSRRIVEELQTKLDLRKLFSRTEADWYARLNPDVSIEDLVTYWQGMTHTDRRAHV